MRTRQVLWVAQKILASTLEDMIARSAQKLEQVL